MAVVEAEPQTFEDIEHLYCGSVYPNASRLKREGCETALCLFSAEWLGRQDVYWLAKAGIDVTCIDLNGEKLERMEQMYPEGFKYIQGDAYDFAEMALEQRQEWDVVTLDPWTGQFDQCAKLIDTWTKLARKVVILGHGNYRLSAPEAPEGWKHTLTIKRSDFKGGINWLVYERA
jgi:hypothetical protein